MLALPGGAYVYQGEELGLPEVEDLPDEVRQDPTFLRTGGERGGRDGCRVPIPWSAAGAAVRLRRRADRVAAAAGGVGGADGRAPSTASPGRCSRCTARHSGYDARSSSRESPLTLDWVESTPGVLAFHRSSRFACVVNVGDDAAPLPKELVGAEVILASDPNAAGDGVLPGGSAVWLRPSAEH